MGLASRTRRPQRPTILLVLLLASALLAFSTSPRARPAVVEPDRVDGIGVGGPIQTDALSPLGTRADFDRLWTADGLEPIVFFASADAPDKAASFDAVLADLSALDVVAPTTDANHGWEDDSLPFALRSESEIKCLAEAIYFEARGESRLGQIAVAQVVINRVKDPAYPKTICGVVYQNRHERHRCQFSFACDGVRHATTDGGSWRAAMNLAREVVLESKRVFLAEVGRSTHYHATYVSPIWAHQMKRMDIIGHHVFYASYDG
jgi:spore germination cell wall hydrolase CwlJ-like protein